MVNSSQSAIGRRILAKGAAWAAPVIVVASAAPAWAASLPTACPSTPVGGGINPATTGDWKWTKTSNANNAPAGALSGTDNTFNMWVDSLNNSSAQVFAVTKAIAVKKGCVYPVRLQVRAQGGYGDGSNPRCRTENTNMFVDMGPATGTRQALFNLSTQSTGGGTVIPFPIQATPPSPGVCPGGFGFGAFQTFVTNYTATATGDTTIKMTFTLAGNNNQGNNDDLQGKIDFSGPCLC